MDARKTILALALLLVPGLALETVAQEEKEWGYNKGFYFRTPEFELKISTRTQFRFAHTDFDEASTFEDRGEFSIPRARLRLDGYAFAPWLKYKVQYDFTGRAYATASSLVIPDTGGTFSLSTRTGPDLRDLYFDVTRNPWASVRLGQFKAPFGIQELTSSGDQEFVDRSIVSLLFAPSREVGTMLWGTSFEKKFGYEAGVFNGNGRNAVVNDNDKLMYVARVHWDPAGEYKLSESSVDHPDKVNWTIGASYLLNSIDAAGDLDIQSGEVFFGLKYKRLFLLANGYARTLETTTGETDQDGYLAQVGCFFVPRKLEVAFRWARLDSDTDLDDNEQTEERVALGWFFSKHDLKFQADYGRIENEASATDNTTYQFRAQLQMVF
jgi:hypothetical protein